MAIPYQNIAKAVAIRANQIIDGSPADIEAAYAAASIEAGMDGVELPYSALKQDILAAEKELAAMVGNSSSSLYRAALVAESGPLDSGDEVPRIDDAGRSFVGSFDGLFDDVDENPLTEQPKQQVLRRIENPGNFFKLPYYGYFIEGSRVFFKCPNDAAYFRGCAWDMAEAEAEFDAEGESPLPQELEVLWACMVLENLPRENWFVPEAQYYSGLVETKQSAIIEGKERIMTMPQIPQKTASAEPTKD